MCGQRARRHRGGARRERGRRARTAAQMVRSDRARRSVGFGAAATIVGDPVRMTGTRLSVFPLPGALLFPGAHLPLHIFEPRYKAMVSDAMARDRRIGMIQPRPGTLRRDGEPALFDLGCVWRIAEIEALDEGRYNLVLRGVSRFRIARELQVTTPLRQVEAQLRDRGAEEETE